MAIVAADYADSFISRALSRVRDHLDEPTTNAKYSDTKIIEQLEFSYPLVIGEVNRNSQTPAVARITITVASGTTTYVLPYTVGSIEAIYEGDGYGGRIFYSSRSQYNPLGRRLWVEGNVIKLQATGLMRVGQELTVEYTPSGTARLHHGACTFNSDGDEATFIAPPTVGTLDTHHEAYTGCVFRHLNTIGTTVTGNVIQERKISAYNNSTLVATLEPALSPVPVTNDGSIIYEIAPAIHKGLDMVVPLHTAWMLSTIEGLGRGPGIQDAYNKSMRHLRLTSYYSNMQEAMQVSSDNFDNRFY